MKLHIRVLFILPIRQWTNCTHSILTHTITYHALLKIYNIQRVYSEYILYYMLNAFLGNKKKLFAFYTWIWGNRMQSWELQTHAGKAGQCSPESFQPAAVTSPSQAHSENIAKCLLHAFLQLFKFFTAQLETDSKFFHSTVANFCINKKPQLLTMRLGSQLLTAVQDAAVTLKVHKIEIFFGFDFEICIISLLVMLKY